MVSQVYQIQNWSQLNPGQGYHRHLLSVAQSTVAYDQWRLYVKSALAMQTQILEL